jgi:hypothetical protein
VLGGEHVEEAKKTNTKNSGEGKEEGGSSKKS